MPWGAPTTGWVDNLGYLRCAECADRAHQVHAVHGDQSFGPDDICERCKKQFVRSGSADFVLTSPPQLSSQEPR